MKRSLFEFTQSKHETITVLTSPNLSTFSFDTETSEKKKKPEHDLLVDIVRPKSLHEIIGHTEAKKIVLQFLDQNQNQNQKRALLLSGPTGCGKTLLARLAIEHTKFQIWDDQILDMSESIYDAIQNLSSKKSLSGKPWCAFIECIEGFVGEERASLLKIIKTSKTPLILTCDDAFEPSNKPFREACIHVRMHQNDTNTILRILFKAGEIYGLKLSPETASNILTNSNHNARLALNTLQLLATTKKTARKGAPLSAADETFNLFTSCSQLCAGTPLAYEKSIQISSSDSDMFISLLHQNCAASSSFRTSTKTQPISTLSTLLEHFSYSDLLMKRFLVDEATSIPTYSMKVHLCIQKPEKISSFPQYFSMLSSKKARTNRLCVSAGVLAEAFLGQERPLYVDEKKLKRSKTKSSVSFTRDVLSQRYMFLSQIRPSGLDAHEILVVLRALVNKRSDYKILKKENLYVTGDPQANAWIQNGVFPTL
jgi:DNA polymerase III delta prime subunit